MTSQPVDPTRCPLCGQDNTCGMASGAATCWCFATEVPAEVLERVPPALRGLACVCEPCASGRRSPAEAQAMLDQLTRER
jgi:cysteine-rich CWC protein